MSFVEPHMDLEVVNVTLNVINMRRFCFNKDIIQNSEIKSENSKSIPRTHIYMATHSSGLVHTFDRR